MSTDTTICSMCGIFGVLSPSNALPECIQGLCRLEYRGYDSAGIAGLQKDNSLFCCKRVGKVHKLKKDLEINSPPLHIAIGHTRWATHGAINTINAHPHTDQAQNIALVHNGIIENASAMRKELENLGVVFLSDTDSEVIAQIVGQLEPFSLDSCYDALERLTGSFAIAFVHKDYPDKLFAYARNAPLVVGVDSLAGTVSLSSDERAFSGQSSELYYLQEKEFCVLRQDQSYIYVLGQQKPLVTHTSCAPYEVMQKDNYKHFMAKEICEQPLILQQQIEQKVILQDFDFQKILILGCGSAYHAGCVAKNLLEECTHCPTTVSIASEFCFSPALSLKDTLVIAISQSGETADTLRAVSVAKERSGQVIALCNSPRSSLVRMASHTVLTQAGMEISVCSTKAFTSQCLTLIQIALTLGNKKDLEKALYALPKSVQHVLSQWDTIQTVATENLYKSYLFVGRQSMYPCALEGALKLREISYLSAWGVMAGELKHGSIALIDENVLTIALCGHQETQHKLYSNLQEIKARNGPILALTSKTVDDLESVADAIIEIGDDLPDFLKPIPYSVACQIHAYCIADYLGEDIDQPRNLAKSVTVE